MNHQMAQHVQSQGRGADTMLVHMTPQEVGGLQALAMAHGGSLTINPDTGLPEAGWLGKLLPTLLGVAGMAFGIPPIWMGAIGAVGGTAITGNLKQGLMAGLGAFGGASMAGAAGIGGAAGHVGSSLGLAGSNAAVMHPLGTAAKVASNVAGGAANTAGNIAQNVVGNVANPMNLPAVNGAINVTGNLAGATAQAAGQTAAKTGLGAISQNFGNAAKAGLGSGLASKAAVPLALAGSTQALSAFSPTPKKGEAPVDEYGYTGPYQAHRQTFDVNSYANPDNPTELAKFDPTKITSAEKKYFGPTTYTDAAGKPWVPGQKTTPTAANATSAMANPVTLTPEQRMQLLGYANGGAVHMSSGSFVMPARETAEFGNGSSGAGQQVLARLGGTPIYGPGDGVSDSISASIDGHQKARVARDEVHFSPQAVARLGNGDHKKGTQKLYALMDKAQKSRTQAKRGQDTGLRAIA